MLSCTFQGGAFPEVTKDPQMVGVQLMLVSSTNCLTFNTCHAEFVYRNMKIYLHFLSYLNI